jgi:hypothetical protein
MERWRICADLMWLAIRTDAELIEVMRRNGDSENNRGEGILTIDWCFMSISDVHTATTAQSGAINWCYHLLS